MTPTPINILIGRATRMGYAFQGPRRSETHMNLDEKLWGLWKWAYDQKGLRSRSLLVNGGGSEKMTYREVDAFITDLWLNRKTQKVVKTSWRGSEKR